MTTTANKSWHDIHDSKKGLFNTSSGVLIDLLHPSVDTINGWDICKGLAYTGRFGGHTFKYYSVAQHSVLVKYLAPPELKKAALLHDASEAYLGDVIKPLKVLLGDKYAYLEARFMGEISLKYGVTQAEFDAVKEYDIQALEMEHKALQKGYLLEWIEWWERNIGTPVSIWQPEYAFDQLLRHFVSLFGDDSQITNMKQLDEDLKTEAIRKVPHNG